MPAGCLHQSHRAAGFSFAAGCAAAGFSFTTRCGGWLLFRGPLRRAAAAWA